MTSLFQRAYLKLHSFFQPLIIFPADFTGNSSDLFIWRNERNFDTIINVVNIFSLVHPFCLKGNHQSDVYDDISILFYSPVGQLIYVHHLSLPPFASESLAIRNFLDFSIPDFGTCCIQHSPRNTADFRDNVNHLADRGYVGYRKNSSDVLSFVHGNYDAVHVAHDLTVTYLSGFTYFKRSNRLQFLFKQYLTYDLYFCNSCPQKQSYCIQAIAIGGDILSSASFILAPGQSYQYVFTPLRDSHLQVVSNMVMARPLIFEHVGTSINAFHA